MPGSDQKEILKILKELEDDSLRSKLELQFIIEELSKRLNRRQASILYLILIGETSQTKISKLLGYSTPTICLDIQKIKNIISTFWKEEFGINIQSRNYKSKL